MANLYQKDDEDVTTASDSDNSTGSSALTSFSIFSKTYKPELTPEERELLKDLLSVFKLDHKELQNKLSPENKTVAGFIKSLFKSMHKLGIPSPKYNPERFLQRGEALTLIPRRTAEDLRERLAPKFHPTPRLTRF